MKIGLIGTGGSGSSTIASELAIKLFLPFIRSSDLTRPLLKEEKYDYSIQVEKFLATTEREFYLVNKRIDEEKKFDNFITDRTTLESFAYALDNMDVFPVEQLNILQCKCLNNMKNYDKLFFVPRREEIGNNGLRTLNVFYQRKIEYIILGLISAWKLNVIHLPREEDQISFVLKNI